MCQSGPPGASHAPGQCPASRRCPERSYAIILGRPTNLWLGVVTAAAGFISVSAIAAGADPVIVANLTGAGAGVMGAVIALVAGQAPSVKAGGEVNVVTPDGEANYRTTVGHR